MGAKEDKINRPRVLALVTDAFGGRGGIAKCMQTALTAIADLPERPSVTVISRSEVPQGTEIPDSISYRRFSAKGKLAFGLDVVSQALFGPQPNLILCGHVHLMPFALAAGQKFKTPVALYLHGIEVWRPPARPTVRRVVPKASLFVAVSEVTRRRFLEWSEVDERKVQMIPNAIRLEDFGPRPKSRELIRKYGLEGKQILMTLCRLDSRQRHKGIDEVLEVLGVLTSIYPRLVYVVAGSGDDTDRLREKAQMLGVRDHVVFTGWVAEEEKTHLYCSADAFVLAGYGDGFGIVLLEAMACGLPVVASCLDGTRTAVLDGKLGQLVNPRDPRSLINGITNALNSPRQVPELLAEFSYATYRSRVSRLFGPLLMSSVT